MISDRDTIFALSSGRPPAAIAVIRISGPKARFGLETMVGRVPSPRQAALARVRDLSGEPIDSALVLWFPAPRSETGEDVVELQLHGGQAVIAAVLATLGRLDGFRLAEPGEFTRRAFENGQLDLTEVEGLADLIAAETEAQRRQAFAHLSGGLGRRAEEWRARLIQACAAVEARIDFSDEGDVSDDISSAFAQAREMREEIAAALNDDRRGERLRDGFVMAVAGPPNAGKSSLFNRLAQREAAIVTPIAGTTRDVIEVHLDLDGYPVTVLDTAGIRATDDPVEQEGVRRARARAAAADLVLWVIDVTRPETSTRGDAPNRTWVVQNKIDCLDSQAQRSLAGDPDTFAISALTGAGMDSLIASLKDFVRTDLAPQGGILIARERHRIALQQTVEALDRALAGSPSRLEIIAEELRLAARALGRLTGRVDVEDILDIIFRDFCIGK
jgi:tRNA modification GTPase